MPLSQNLQRKATVRSMAWPCYVVKLTSKVDCRICVNKATTMMQFCLAVPFANKLKGRNHRKNNQTASGASKKTSMTSENLFLPWFWIYDPFEYGISNEDESEIGKTSYYRVYTYHLQCIALRAAKIRWRNSNCSSCTIDFKNRMPTCERALQGRSLV